MILHRRRLGVDVGMACIRLAAEKRAVDGAIGLL
jgi:hypothetical protein